MSLKKAFGTNQSKENEGTWIDVTVNDDGTICSVKLARMNQRNKEFQKRIAAIQKTRRNKTIRNAPNVVTADDRKLAIDAFVGSVLLDWKNVVDYRAEFVGKDAAGIEVKMPFNEENAKFVLTDIPDFFDLLSEEATKIENFQDQIDGEASKN